MGEIASGILNAAGLNASTFLYSLAAVLAGAWLKGYTGFGASMLWMTSLSMVLPPLQVVPMVLMFEVVTSITLLPQIWRDVRWRSIALLLLGTWAATRLNAPVQVNIALASGRNPKFESTAIPIMFCEAMVMMNKRSASPGTRRRVSTMRR